MSTPVKLNRTLNKTLAMTEQNKRSHIKNSLIAVADNIKTPSNLNLDH
jgi:hypothetical protein